MDEKRASIEGILEQAPLRGLLRLDGHDFGLAMALVYAARFGFCLAQQQRPASKRMTKRQGKAKRGSR